MDLNKIAVNEKAELEGAWVPVDDKTSFLIARMNNKKYLQVMQEKSNPYRQALRQNLLNEEISNKIVYETYAQTILLDWKGLTENGVEIPYSKEAAIRILSSYSELFNFVSRAAESFELYRKKDEAEEIKN